MVNYSFVVPVYNDGDLAPGFCREFLLTFQKYLNKSDISHEVELIFVNDGSIDDSWLKLTDLVQQYPFVKGVCLSRNFGQHIAISCGFQQATGKFVGMMNVDMQDPPSQIPLLLDAIRSQEFDIVYGQYSKRHVSFLNRITSVGFYWLLGRLTGYPIPPNCSTLRVMSRRFVDSYNQFVERSRFIPGLESWLGPKQGFVPVEHQDRKKGRSSYNQRKRLALAIDSIISFSDIPLRWAVFTGMSIAIMGLLLMMGLIIQKMFFVQMRPGYTSTISVIIFLGGVQILSVGLASLYIGKILKEVQGRPLYVIRQKVNF